MKKFPVLASAAILAAMVPGITNAQHRSAAKMSYSVMLAGKNDINPAGAKKGHGTATVNIDMSKLKVCYSITAAGIALPALAAHIHAGKAGTNGGVVITLTPPSSNGRSVGCVKASSSVLKAIVKSPSSFYVNVHTKSFPAGAIRGQL